MPSRVTQSMMNAQLLRNLNANMTRMERTQDQLSTGRRINKPSDDPVGISYAMRYRSEISANEQYRENVDSAISWLEHTDSAMDSAGAVLQRVRELTVNASNGTNPQQALNAISSEVNQLYEQLVNIGNSQFNGKYVFGGQITDIKPYSLETAAVDSTDEGIIQFEIGAGVKLPVNIPGNHIFGNPGSPNNAFQVLQSIKSAIDSGNLNGVSEQLGNLDAQINQFLEIRAEVGAKINRVELANDRLGDIDINLQSLQSKVEDADMAQIITNMKMDENVYQASLSVGAQIIRPTLVDFLR